MEQELEWRPIPECPNYEITRTGDIRNKSTLLPIKTKANFSGGPLNVRLTKDGRQLHRSVFSLVTSAFPEVRRYVKYVRTQKTQGL